MSAAPAAPSGRATTEPDAARSLRLFSTLIAVAALSVLLQ